MSGGRAVRRRQLGAWCLLCASLGCACITGEIRTGEDSLPPRVAYNQVDPKPGLVVVSDTATQLPLAFRVLQFEEPNTRDTLTVRWFVDYHRNRAIQQQVVRPPENPGAAAGLRAGNQFRLTLAMLEPNPTAAPHVVEVVVCDRAFDDRDDAPEPNRTCGPDALGTVVSWTVQVTTGGAGKPTASRGGAR